MATPENYAQAAAEARNLLDETGMSPRQLDADRLRWVERTAKAREEVAQLRAALMPFAKARTPEGYFGTTPTHADFMAARTALGMQAGPVPATPTE